MLFYSIFSLCYTSSLPLSPYEAHHQTWAQLINLYNFFLLINTGVKLWRSRIWLLSRANDRAVDFFFCQTNTYISVPCGVILAPKKPPIHLRGWQWDVPVITNLVFPHCSHDKECCRGTHCYSTLCICPVYCSLILGWTWVKVVIL